MPAQRLLVRRDRLHETRLDADPPDATHPLADGEVRLAIERFGLSANNITYAAFGDSLQYWRFFPADDGWGTVPVWGFATVAESRMPGLAVGERLYGYLPMATHLVVRPARVGAAGFVDASEHRQGLSAVYNRYERCAADPGYRAEHEAQQALLRPLFVTSFLIDHFLADAGFFGARRVLMSSASSKTAYGTAFGLSRRDPGVQRVGLSSPSNLGFVRSLGVYDEVLDYAALQTLDARTPTVYVDVAGDAPLRRQVHAHFDAQLRYSCAVGGTHWQALGGSGGLAGPRPVLFFAPSEAQRRASPPPDGWGPQGFARRVAEAWSAFVASVTRPTDPWLIVAPATGAAAVREAYLALLEGRSDPRRGHWLAF